EKVDLGSGSKPNAGQWASLDIDIDNNPVIAHYDGGKANLRVSRLNDGTWNTEEAFTGEIFDGVENGEPVYRAADAGTYARLVIDGDKEYIAFYDGGQQSLNLLEGYGGNYTHTVIDKIGNVGQWPSIWADGDNIMIAYQDVGNQDLRVATRESGVFTSHVADEGEFRGADTEIFLIDGIFSIVYFDGQDNNMMLATQAGTTSWDIETLGGENTAVGFHNEVIVVGETTWVASYDFTGRDIFLQTLTE
ncbi:MAG: hypothetical protein HN348_09445, partial [Proteobacteria bacterium]|nr:hypothetical protein [Pseudomonadota bacterium]